MLAGTERVLTDKMNYLAHKGYDVYVITYEQGEHPYAYYLHTSIHRIDLNECFFRIGKYNFFKKLIVYRKMKIGFRKKLKITLSDINPDILICTTYSLRIINDIFKASNNVKCKIIESHVSINSIFKRNDFSKFNPLYYASYWMDNNAMKILKKFNKVIVLTNKESKLWVNNGIKPLIINNPTTYYPSEYKEPQNNHTILCVGRLESQKGFDLLINAWSKIYSKYKDWHINIYGNGGLKSILERQIIETINNDSVRIFNPVQNIYDKYNDADFFVLSSRAEGFGLVLAEAMSCGRPCVSFNCPYGPDEIITDGVDGLLAKNGDVDDLAEKMEWMITHDKERKEMGLRARESAKRYDKEKIMAQWINLFNEFKRNKN